jgi:DNA modification methylase
MGEVVIEQAYDKNISAGKNTYVYDAHTYHTKVPPQGIKPIIEYYTKVGETVLDPFCGSGMTGVAAAETKRKAILSDLSPAAVFIAKNINSPIDHAKYMGAVDEIIQKAESLSRYLYTTTCRTCKQETPLLYTVWSYGVKCGCCGNEVILWDVVRDEKPTVKESKIKKEFQCPHCYSNQAKRGLKRTKKYPVQVGYKCCGSGNKEQTAPLNTFDKNRIKDIERQGIPSDLWYPTDKFPDGVNTKQPKAAGIDSIDKAYTTRALWAMAYLWKEASEYIDVEISEKLKFAITSLYQRVTLFSEFRFWGGSGNVANYNVPQIINEQNVFLTFRRKAATISWYFRDAPKFSRNVTTRVESATNLSSVKDGTVDFIFTDPPFGSNINYSEMNFLWECWLQNKTIIRNEAIVNKVQGKGLLEYQNLLCASFKECKRVLKDNSWMCVVFHNSSEKVWATLQNAISESGFVVKGAQTFDKQHGTFKMFVSDNAVGYDIVLHCQKRIKADAYSAINHINDDSVSEFIRENIKSSNSYNVEYLHVARSDEFDYRKLYSEWLCSVFSESAIEIDFEKFRAIVDAVRKDTNA